LKQLFTSHTSPQHLSMGIETTLHFPYFAPTPEYGH
jgi:hypothetical protein